MTFCRLLVLLACLSGSASAQTAGAPRPIRPPTPRPPVIATPRPLPMEATPAPRRRLLPMPGRPGRFIICPGDRRCPRRN